MNLGPKVSCGIFNPRQIGTAEQKVDSIITTTMVLAGQDLDTRLTSLVIPAATSTTAGISDTNFTLALNNKLVALTPVASWLPSSDPGYLTATSTTITDITSDVSANTAKVTYPGPQDLSALATIAGPTFTGTVTLPASTSVGSVTAAELAHLSGVTSTVQTQLTSKQATLLAPTSAAASGGGNLTLAGNQLTYVPPDLSTLAPSASPTFSGTVSLPINTSIGSVTATMLSHISGVTSNVQAQLGTKQLALDTPVIAAASGSGSLTLTTSSGFNTLLTYTPPDLSSFSSGGSSSVATTDNSTNVDYNFVFTDGAGASKNLLVDSTTLPSTINPSTGAVTIADMLKVNSDNITIGKHDGQFGQSNHAIAIGWRSGRHNQSIGAVGLGHEAGYNEQGDYAIALGYRSAYTLQADNSISLNASGVLNSCPNSGLYITPIRNTTSTSLSTLHYDTTSHEIFERAAAAGLATVGTTESNANVVYNLVFTDGAGASKTLLVDSVTLPSTINPSTGEFLLSNTLRIDGLSSGGRVSVGKNVDQNGQGSQAVAVGNNAGKNNQSLGAVGLGYQSGYNAQGSYAVSLGYQAGYTNQSANSISINASGAPQSCPNAGLYIEPIRNIADPSGLKSLYYNTTSHEIFEGATPSGSSTGSFTTLAVSGTSTLAQTDVLNLTASNNLSVAAQTDLNNVTVTGSAGFVNLLASGTLGVTGATTVSTFTASGQVNCNANAQVGGTLTVTGQSNLNSAVVCGGALTATAGTTNLAVTNVSNLTASGTIGVTGTSTLGQINCGAIIGSATLNVSGTSALGQVNAVNVATSGTLNVSGVTTLSNTVNTGPLTCTGLNTGSGNIVCGGSQVNAGYTEINGQLVVPNTSSLGTVFASALLTCNGGLTNAGVTTLNSTVYINNALLLTGALIQNGPLFLNDPSSAQTLTINDAGRNVLINNNFNQTNIYLPRLNTITNDGQVIFTFCVQVTSQVFYIRKNANDSGNIVGTVVNNDGACTRIDSDKITGSASLKPGDSINISNFRNGDAKSWFISAGGINTTGSGFTG
jgi:hypothetical protein